MKQFYTLSTLLLISSMVISQHLAVYEVQADKAGFTVSYLNEGGNTEQMKVNQSSWRKAFYADKGAILSLTAQASKENTTLVVNIFYDNNLIETAKSSGDYVVATVSGAAIFKKRKASASDLQGKQSVYTYSPLYKERNLTSQANALVHDTVELIRRVNEKWYYGRSGEAEGYFFVGFIKK